MIVPYVVTINGPAMVGYQRYYSVYRLWYHTISARHRDRRGRKNERKMRARDDGRRAAVFFDSTKCCVLSNNNVLTRKQEDTIPDWRYRLGEISCDHSHFFLWYSTLPFFHSHSMQQNYCSSTDQATKLLPITVASNNIGAS